MLRDFAERCLLGRLWKSAIKRTAGVRDPQKDEPQIRSEIGHHPPAKPSNGKGRREAGPFPIYR